MKVVVTGTSGRVGQAICQALCKNHEVTGIDRAPSSATTHVGDINNADLLNRIFDGADAVIHTAALHAPHVGRESDQEFMRVNVDGTSTVALCARSCGVRKLIFTSTTALYGAASHDLKQAAWLDETSKPEPRTIYHYSKIAAEKILESVACAELPVVVLRMSRCFPEPAPAMAIYRLHRGIDARDVGHGHQLALSIQGAAFQRYILSGATPFDKTDCEALSTDPESVLRLKSPEICRIFDARGWQFPHSIDRVYDSTFAQRSLGWKPRYGPESVIKQLDEMDPEVLPPEAAGAGAIE